MKNRFQMIFVEALHQFTIDNFWNKKIVTLSSIVDCHKGLELGCDLTVDVTVCWYRARKKNVTITNLDIFASFWSWAKNFWENILGVHKFFLGKFWSRSKHPQTHKSKIGHFWLPWKMAKKGFWPPFWRLVVPGVSMASQIFSTGLSFLIKKF